MFVGPYRLAPKVLGALTMLQPEAVIRWDRAGFRAYWRWQSITGPVPTQQAGHGALFRTRPRGVTAATLAGMREKGLILQLSRGLYQLPDAGGDANQVLAEATKFEGRRMSGLGAGLSPAHRHHSAQRVDETQARTPGSRINRPGETRESQVGERRHVAGGPRISFVHLEAESNVLRGGADDADVNRANRFQPGFVPRARQVRWGIGRSD